METQTANTTPGTAASAGIVITDHFAWSEPEPLENPLPPVEQFDLDVLPDQIRPWADDVAERMQCPPEFPAAGLVIGLGAVIGRKVCIRPKREDDWTVVPNLWGTIVGPPAVMKTPALEQALIPMQRLEDAAMRDYDRRCRESAAEQLVQKERSELSRRLILKALKEGNEDLARDAAEKVQAASDALSATMKRFIVNDPTMEKLGELLQENPNGLLLHRDELIGFLRSLDRDGREDYRAFYLEAWNGAAPFTFDRIGRGTVRIEAVTLSMIGAIQPEVLGDYVRHAAADGSLGAGDGMLQRFQVTLWPDCGTDWANVDRSPRREARDRVTAVFERLAALEPAAVGAELERLPFLRFAPEAQAAFDDWRAALEAKVRCPSEHPALQGHLAKYRKLVPALALITHLADGQTGPVGTRPLAKALGWARILESHARRLYSSATRHTTSSAKILAARLAKGQLGKLFSLRDLYRKGWIGLGTKEEAENALQVLEANGYVRRRHLQLDPGKPGRPASEVFQVNPCVLGSSPVQADRSATTDRPELSVVSTTTG